MDTVVALAGMLLNILKVVFGLGFVIFIHELGHFLAAKWNGVKVEKFFLGFDWPFGLKIASFRYGETLYGIGVLPLGGYVKMLGESTEEGADKATDPRAFSNKSIGARIVVLSAGVVMNLLLGLTLFTVAYMIGVTETPAKIGLVQAGSPAYEAGLRPGDELVSMDGSRDIHFSRLVLKVALSGSDQAIRFGVSRPGVGELTIPIVPTRRAKADRPNIGISPAESLDLSETKPYTAPPGVDGTAPNLEDLAGGGTVVEAGPSGGVLIPVREPFELDRVFAANRDKPVDVVIEVKGEKGSPPKRLKATLPVNRMLTLGLRLTPGPVASIQAGSIAEAAGFRKGDVLVKVDGRDDFDPMRLPDELYALAGKPVVFVVARKVEGKDQTLEITATPDATVPGVEPLTGDTKALKLPGLGLAIEVETKVAAVAPGSPAAGAGIKPGATIASLTFPADPELGKSAKATRVVLVKPTEPVEAPGLWAWVRAYFSGKPATVEIESSWPFVFSYLQDRKPGEIEIRLAGESAPIKITPAPDQTWMSTTRGLNFLQVSRDLPPQPFGQAIKRGSDETYDNVVSIYAMIRSLFSGRVSTKNLAGLPRIADIAYRTASLGFVPLLQFLGMLSINLAVLNFLPISPLDGGQIAFLVAEKVRGKPLPESAQVALLYLGAGMVICLMLFTVLQDLKLMIFG